MMNKRLELIDLDQLDLRLSVFRSSSPASIERMRSSLSQRGQLTPITVTAEKNRLTLIDGFKRRQAALAMGINGLEATVVSAGPAQAKSMIYLLNRPGGITMISEALLIRDLVEVEGLSQSETAILLDRHKSWVSRRLMMIRALSPEVVDDIKLKLLPPGVGPSLARLPHGNQADFSAAIIKHGLGPKEVDGLVDLWCKTKETAVKQWFLESPREALTITGSPSDWSESCLAQLHSISGKLKRLCKRLKETPSGNVATVLELLAQMALQIEQINTYLGGNDESIK